MNEPISKMTTAQMIGCGRMEIRYAMPMTVNTMIAIVDAGANCFNKRPPLHDKWLVRDGSFINIYGIGWL